MVVTTKILNKDWKLICALFAVTFLIYTFHFHTIFFNLNSLLSSITSDTLKNYYTYIYHIKHDVSALHFSGMAYPYGEHVVYTDCQPILTFVLRYLPFTHNYLIGILHALIFLSFMYVPIIIFKTFRLFEVGQFTSFFCALGVGLLSPQFLKINAGHHGLAYAFVIPYSIYLLVKYSKTQSQRVLCHLFFYHCFLFLLHPYHGFSAGLFSLIAFLISDCFVLKQKGIIKKIVAHSAVSLGPVILFRMFMLLTDTHPNRTNEPYGLNMMIENIDSLLAPTFGPLKSMMEVFFNNRVNHYEGHTYLGATSIGLTIALIVLLPLFYKRFQFKRETLALLLSAFVLLMVSFGWHYKLFDKLGLNTAFMNQFRATCRFAWFFYYCLPLFLIVTFYHSFKSFNFQAKTIKFFYALPLLFAGFNLVEAHSMFKLDDDIFWKFRNFFNVNLLNVEEEKTLSYIREAKREAIVPFPLFYSGSEMYDRKGFNYSMIPSMLYASHSGIPILSVLMSRTSLTETEQVINLLNSYKKERPALALVNKNSFIVMKTERDMMPDEERIWRNVNVFTRNDTLEIGSIDYNSFLKRKLDKQVITLDASKVQLPDSNHVVYIPFENRKPFLKANMNGAETVFVLDSNYVKSGNYVLSTRYYYQLKNYHALACDMVVTERGANEYYWKYILPFRFLSGFYDGYAIMEAAVEIKHNKKYEFFISGREEREYHISDFMLRPMDVTVKTITAKGDTVFNNFPK